MLLALDAAVVMHKLSERLQESSYVTLISLGLGSPKSSTLALACVLLAGWGSAVAWLKFLADNLNRFGPTPLPQAAYIAILAVPLTLCAWVEEISILERFSSIGLVAGQCFVLLIFVLAVPHWSQLPDYLASQPFVRWDSFPVAMGIAVFCNEGMVVMSSEVSVAMHPPKQFKLAVTLAVSYFTLNYLLLALCGDFLYSYLPGDGAVVAQEVTLSPSFAVTWAHRVAVLCYGIQLLLTFPSSLFVMFRNMEHFHWTGQRSACSKRAWRVALILSFCACAMVLPRFGDFLAVFGAVANSMCIYVLPHLTWLSQSEMQRSAGDASDGAEISLLRQVWSGFVVSFFGVCCGALAAVVSLKQLL